MPNLVKYASFTSNSSLETIFLTMGSNRIEITLQQVETADRPHGFQFSKYIVGVKAMAGNISAQGSGESQDSSKEALEKAKSESIERLMLKLHCSNLGIKDTSNGWAAHYSAQEAQKVAALELFERDGALVQWYRRESLVEITGNSLPIRLRFWKWAELAKSEFPELKLLITTEGFYPTVLAVLQNKQGNGIIGTASSSNLLSATTSAITEACRSAHHFIRGTYIDDLEKLLSSGKDNPSPGAHAVLYAENMALPGWLLRSTVKKSWNEARELFSDENLNLAISQVGMKFETIATGPRYVVKAESQNLQPIYWGITNLEKLNIKRIEKPIHSINLLPHFVG